MARLMPGMCSFGKCLKKKRTVFLIFYFCCIKHTDIYSDASGKEVLTTLITDHKQEYENLTDKEHEEVVCLFEESKPTVATAKYVSPKAQINNVSYMLIFIEVDRQLEAGKIQDHKYVNSEQEIMILVLLESCKKTGWPWPNPTGPPGQGQGQKKHPWPCLAWPADSLYVI